MILLTATTHSLALITTVGTTSISVSTSSVDITTTTFVPVSFDATVTTATTTTVVVAPAASTQRQVKSLFIRNTHSTVSDTISVAKVVSAVPFSITGQVLLAPGELLQYIDGVGWKVFDASGAIKTTYIYPVGTDGSLFYSNNGIVDTSPLVRVDSADGQLMLQSVGATTPVTPPTGLLKVFNRQIAGRNMLAQVGPSGLDTAFQPLLARNKVGFWCPPGNATTVPGVLGFTAFTAIGTATARNVATTNMFARLRRLGYVSVSTAGSLAGAYVPLAQVSTGTTLTVPIGGFFKVIRFGTSDAATVTGARMFVGVSTNIGAQTNVEPSTLTNSIGVAQLSSGNTLQIVYGGSVAQTPINLGANFPASSLSVDVYELALFNAPGVEDTVYYQVTRLNTGDVATGTLTGAVGTVLPSSTSLMSYSRNWRCNNATALAVGLDIFSDYIETDQ